MIGIDRSGLNPVADLRLLREYRRILKRLRPAAFLGFTIKPNIYGCIAARALGIPAIANISGLGTVFIKRGLLLAFVTRLYRFALSRAAIVFFQNPTTAPCSSSGAWSGRSRPGCFPAPESTSTGLRPRRSLWARRPSC